jgi:dihydrofolate synthase/folylpolyglutamate synthase
VSGHLQHALEALYGLERRKDKLGLEGTRSLLAALGNPERRFRAVHVAGTNGKGSVCALIERVLRAAGHRTGLFTSPHLVDFRERIRVAGRWADEARLEDRLARIQSLPEGRDRTFFEVCTALAFDDFAARGVEWAVVEVGLGGRLDCTNVLAPEVCVITNIGFDHTEILGETIERIAEEKAGIIKPGVPVVTGPLAPRAREVIARIAADRGAPMGSDGGLAPPARGGGPRRVRVRATAWGDLELEVGMAGSFQAANAGLALAALSRLRDSGLAIDAGAVRDGMRAARWPGRLEACPSQPRLWWDGAHNAEGAAALAAAWVGMGLPAPGAVVLAVSRDKDLEGITGALAGLARGARLVATRTRVLRAAEPEGIARVAAARGFEARVGPDVPAACRAALAEAGPDRLVLLTGSLFAVGEAMEVFGGAPGEDL